MAYIGNDLQVAYPTYKNIDDISGSFNSSATSFPLLVNGVAPVPLPLNSQQCLISVGGVVQRPDDSGTEGFRLSGGNIIFASAPTTGADFFGVILAGADYVNAGGTFPSGSAAVPSITFNDDVDTGIYNSGPNQLSFSTSGVERLRIDSAGQIETGSLGSAASPAFSFLNDANTGIYSPGADQLALSTGGTGRIFVDSSGRLLVGTSLSAGQGVNLQIEGLSFADSGLQVRRNSADSSASSLILMKSRGTTKGSVTSIANNDSLGQIVFFGADGTNDLQAASIIAQVDGTPGTNDMPGRLVFSTTADGASSPTERLRIDSSGRVGIGTTAPNRTLEVNANNGTNNSILPALRLKTGSVPGAAGYGTGLEFTVQASNNFEFVSARVESSYTDATTFAGDMRFLTTGVGNNLTERARIDSYGRLLVGTSSARANLYNASYAPLAQIEHTNDLTQRTLNLAFNNANASAGGPILSFTTSRGSTNGSNTLVANNDELGIINFLGTDGTRPILGASITAYVDGAPGNFDMPGRLVFSTTADGASNPTEHLRITNNGGVKASVDGTYLAASTAYHEWRSNRADWVASITNTHASLPFGIQIAHLNAIPNSTGCEFLYCSDNAALRASIRSNGGLANFQVNNVNLSDINTKKDIALAAGTWNCVKEWEIVNYRYKDQPDDADLNLGVIAQQVQESCPEVVTVFQEAKEATEDRPAQEERLGVREQQMYWMAIKALQEAMARIEQLEAKVAAFEGA